MTRSGGEGPGEVWLVPAELPGGSPVTRLTGLRLSEVGLGMASAWMPASAWWQSAARVFLAGTTAFVANLALSSSVLTSARAGMGVTTTELSVSFLRAATVTSQTIIGRGRLLGHSSSRPVLYRATRRFSRKSAASSPSG